ncbi:msr-110 isoform X3 [Lycorma delicatula]|uniref:msr-110 isoform X3 n=1 Tax=Lycorma delicatula TaxID=130591 RepID=UPI003F51686B
MEKQQEAAQDSISTMGKPEYPPSEVYVPEPPPAYRRERGTAVQIARIAALTIVAVSVIISFSMLATSYITATMSCAHYDQQQQDNPQAQPLIQQQSQNEQEEPSSYQHLVDPLQSDESSDNKHETMLPPPPPPSTADTPSIMQIKLPLTLDFDDIAGSLMEKNQRSRMNCVVEKKRAEEVMNHQPKTVRLPFGLNVTTDPRYEHITGERMAIFCESGHDQRHIPMEAAGTPIVVPVPIHHAPIPEGIPQMPMHHGPMHHHQNEQQMPQNIPMMSHHGPIPIMATHQQMPPQNQQINQPQAISLSQIPIPVLTRIAQESLGESGNEPVHIIAREENIIPMEGRAMHHQHPVPSDMVRPPPLPSFQRIPVHVMQQQAPNAPHPIALAAAAAASSDEPEQPRPHFVHPRSVRSVDSVFHKREKRMRRCACDCSC